MRYLSILILTATIAFSAEWETLENCRLVSSSKNDGDSFVVEHNGQEYNFRLFFVDTPETGLFYPERVQQQADYFGTDIDAMLRIGERSEDFADHFLSGRFTVYTQWSDAMGYGKRYAAVIYNRRGESLVEALVENGLARIKGFRPTSAWPGGESASKYIQDLEKLERSAKRKNEGAWRKSSANSEARASRFDEKTEETQETAEPGPQRVDVNQASRDELIALPGIGPVYAERILEQRPFIGIDELVRVRGIGAKTLEKLRPFLTLTLPDHFAGTANYYLLEPERWANRQITLRVSGLSPLDVESPDEFNAFAANTSTDAVDGGTLPLYLHDERVPSAMSYFAQTNQPIDLEVFFFRYRGEWVAVLRED